MNDTCEQRLGGIGFAVNRGLSFVDDDAVGQVGGHDEIVLHHECGLLGMQNVSLDDLGGNNTLFRVQVGRGLIYQINIRGFAQRQDDGNSLQLSSRQMQNLKSKEKQYYI